MASSFENYNKRRLISSYFSVVLSIFLVLFLLGTLGLFVINSKKITNDFKENIPMTVFFKNEAKDSALNAFDTQLKNSRFIKEYAFHMNISGNIYFDIFTVIMAHFTFFLFSHPFFLFPV